MTNYPHDIVNVADWTYIFNGNTYTTLGGVFKKVFDTLLTENGATIIVSNDSTRWQREFDRIHYIPEWYEVGGYNQHGKWESVHNNAGTESSPLVPGIYNDTDRLVSIVELAGAGKTILLGTKVNEYFLDREVLMEVNQFFIGNGTKISRANSPVTNVSTGINLGPNVVGTFTVNSFEGFRVGQKIIALDVSQPNGGIGYEENGGFMTISRIEGNEITVVTWASASGNVANGARIMTCNGLLVNKYNDQGTLAIRDITFDGNRSNNGNFQFSADWRFNFTIGTGGDTKNVQISNCHIQNTPSENINIARGIVSNCTFSSLGGSFIHISNSNQEYSGVTVETCTGRGVCLVTNNVGGHMEGAITLSNWPFNIKISNCHFYDGEEAIIGKLGPATVGFIDNNVGDISVSNSKFNNFNSILYGNMFNSEQNLQNIFISNSTMNNCGDIAIRGSDNSDNRIFRFINNQFKNTRILFSNCKDLIIKGNTFHGKNYIPSNILSNNPAQIIFEKNISNVQIEGNSFIIDTNTYDSQCPVGIVFEEFNFFQKSSINPKFYKSRHFKIINNYFHASKEELVC